MQIKQWKLNFKEHRGLECSVPCSVYSTLLEHGLMDDPFYGLNEQAATELSRMGCEFYTAIEAGGEVLAKKHILLRFEGLDTLCAIHINGRKIAETDNMHRTYEFDVKPYLREGHNEIRIKISSPILYIEKMHKMHKLFTNADTIAGAAHIRKASYMFGWDWGPTLPDMGIFRPVSLIAYDYGRLENVLIHQVHEDASVTLDMELEAIGGTACRATVNGRTYDFTENTCSVKIENPRLWWPSGYGEQNLYTLKFELLQGECVIDTMEKTIGLRTLTVSTEPDGYGEEFCFVVNGIKIFSMGANYVPMDNILSRVTEERLEGLIQDCIKANFNSIRVWGGGYYPEDAFYDLCDRYGLIVWQDFMVACMNIWLRRPVEETMTAEAIDNVKRLRHHASLGLLCGNNEMELAILDWDNVGDSDLVKADYLRLYEHLLPDICAEYAPDVFYWPASPSSGGGFDNPADESRGDAHYWDVWHGSKPFEEYRRHYFRFLSEFGFESFPSMKTVKAFAQEKDINAFSPVMENHQKCKAGNAKILTYCAANYLYATSFEALVYASQLNQADAIKYGVEHMRRHRGRCMGAIYWQLNDCWPVASWASVDYFGRWKALHYAAKRFFAPVLLSLHEAGHKVTINVSNETMDSFCGTIKYAVKDNFFNEITSGETAVCTGKLSSLDVVTTDLADALKGHEGERYLTCELFGADGNAISRQTLLFAKPKQYSFEKPDIKVALSENTLIVTSDCFAKGVEIDFDNTDIRLSDNYFDITSKEGVTIETDGALTQELLAQLKVKTVYDVR